MKKPGTIILVPTDKHHRGQGLYFVTNKENKEVLGNMWHGHNPQIAVLVDESEIKEGEKRFIVDQREGMNNFIHEVTQKLPNTLIILATSSKLYNIPQFQSSTIEQLISLYNEKPFKELGVEVEYEPIRWQLGDSKERVKQSFKGEIELKLSKNNEVYITIPNKQEKMYTETELKSFAEWCLEAPIHYKDNTVYGNVYNIEGTDKEYTIKDLLKEYLNLNK